MKISPSKNPLDGTMVTFSNNVTYVTFKWSSHVSLKLTITHLAVTVGSDRDNPQPLVVTSHPQDVQITHGHYVTLEVKTYGTMPLCYQWYFGNTIIPGTLNDVLYSYIYL